MRIKSAVCWADMSDILLIPHVTKNQLSISKLTRENNCSVTFSSGFTIHDPSHKNSGGSRAL